MITLNARIKLSEANGDITDNEINIGAINVSSDISQTISNDKMFPEANPFILGSSRLGSGAVYTSKVNYFVSRIMSNENGVLPQEVELIVNGNDIDFLVLAFDTENSVYPPFVIVDNDETVYSQDPRYEIKFKNIADTHSIKFSKLNKPFSPVIISSMYVNLSINIDKTNLLSYNSSIADRGNFEEPVYGLISNSGSIEFNDIDSEVYNYIVQQIVKSRNIIEIWLYNSDSEGKDKVATYSTNQWSYNNDNRTVSIQLKDLLEDWQKINISGINYIPTISEPKTAEWLYTQLYNFTTTTKLLAFNELDSITQEHLSNIIIDYPVLESDSLWGEWTKLCECCLLHMYIDSDNNIVAKYSGKTQ